MDYRQYQAPQPANTMLSSARGMARLNGSNRAAWNAMDLEIGAQAPPLNARNAPEDDRALSARNILLRQKLRERKRYDSADDAMKKAAARAANRYQPQPQHPVQNQMQPSEQPLSPAQIGQSAFFNAMQSESPKRNVQRNAPTSLYEPPGGAEHGRNVLIQRKLQSKQSFDSADYQMAMARRGHEMEDTHMEDVSEAEHVKEEEAASSPCASSTNASRRQQFASMSPSRAGKYGALENKKKPSRRDLLEKKQEEEPAERAQQGSNYGKLSAAHVLIRRKLKERKRFDSADYAMEKQGQPTDVPADVAANPAAPIEGAVPFGMLGASQTSIDHQVKHIKLSEDPSGRVVSAQPVVANAAQAALAARAARYAGLKGAGSAKPTTGDSTPQAALDRYGLDKSAATMGPAAVARNVVLQRKLAERKIFDSADHFQKAA